MNNPKAYRLPTHALPGHYEVQIDARLGREDFHGNVAIQLEIKEARDTIEIHARDLDLSNAVLTTNGKSLEGKIQQDSEREMASIAFGEAVPVGNATLEIAFKGKISKALKGLYLAKDGEEECLCTQCEPVDARAIFPCFDEPTFKAHFAWQVTTSPDATVLANGPLVSTSTSDDGKSKTWTFAPTRLMSSYLVALVIGDIEGTKEETVNGTPIRVWGMKGKGEMGQFSHNFTKRLLPWFEDYFDLPYHFDKYDQVGVPGFSAGAMENSGLVLFRQSRLLVDPKTASWNQEKAVAHVVAHEFAHMWFGNVVTMRWWDDLWLNEAFAEWVSTKAVDELEPDYHVWDDSQSGKSSALSADALESTHPIYSPVETPAQAEEMFDAITYEKGCAVLRMLETFLGAETFRAGLRTYMKEFKEGNAAGADLWRHLQNASSQPVTKIMESWVAQGGYPVVNVSLERSGGSQALKLSQKRFFSTPNMSAPEQLWNIPLVIRYADEGGTHEKRYLLTEGEATLPLELDGHLRWLYANTEDIGFYRQHLDGDLMEMALNNLDKLSPIEQMGLLGDQWALVRNGSQRMSRFLDVLSAMMGSRNYSVLGRVDGYLHNVEKLLEDAKDETALSNFRNWVGRSFKERLSELGFEPRTGESQNETQSRPSVVDAVTALAHDTQSVDQSVKYADREAADPSSVDPNLASTFVQVAAQFGDDARMDRYVQIYEQRRREGRSPEEVNRYLNSLASFHQPEQVGKVFQLMDEKVIPLEAIGPLMRTMLARTYSQVQAWEYFKKNWTTMSNDIGTMWAGFLVEATGQLPSDKRADMVQFYDTHLNGLAEKSYSRALEMLDQLAEFKARTRDDLVGWFKK